MNEAGNLARDYEMRESDPLSWLRMAKGFMSSARVIWDELRPLLGPRGFADDNLDQLLAYWQSFLLLTAFAFENLYRGLLTSTGRSWREALAAKGGHALAKHIESVTRLDEDEANLIERLETYLIWAGRYIVPKDAAVYHDALKQFRIVVMGSDLHTAERLFGRLEQKLKADVAAHRTR